MTRKEFKKKDQEEELEPVSKSIARDTKAIFDMDEVESTSKVVDPIADHLDRKGEARLPYSLKFFCTVCTKNYEIFKKDKDGNLDKQQICQHMTFLETRFE